MKNEKKNKHDGVENRNDGAISDNLNQRTDWYGIRWWHHWNATCVFFQVEASTLNNQWN